jgi:hypothetical protein
MKGRLGKAEGIVSAAHKLARIVYRLIATGKAYEEKEAFHITPATLHRRLQNLQKQAAALGLQLRRRHWDGTANTRSSKNSSSRPS